MRHIFTKGLVLLTTVVRQGTTTELCKWTVDLTSLPTFQKNVSIPQPNGFYTGMNLPFCFDLRSHSEPEFELGLELDSAEVRGILLYEGQEWGRVVFDFRN
jgi:hypothetical protein